MAHKNKKFTKNSVAQRLGIQEYMISAWEKEFGITPSHDDAEEGYTQEHVQTFSRIKELLYEKGFSLTAAKKYLKDGSSPEGIILQAATVLKFEMNAPEKASSVQNHAPSDTVLAQKLESIKEQLLKIRNTL